MLCLRSPGWWTVGPPEHRAKRAIRCPRLPVLRLSAKVVGHPPRRPPLERYSTQTSQRPIEESKSHRMAGVPTSTSERRMVAPTAWRVPNYMVGRMAATAATASVLRVSRNWASPPLWKSVGRGPEIDRRLSRESSALNSMEASMGVCSDPELTAKGWKLCADTKHQAKAVFSMKEGCRTIRGAQVQELINEVLATGGSLAPMLSSNDFDLRKRLAADTSTLVDFLLVTAVEHTAMVLIQVWSPEPGLHGTFEGQAQDHPGGTCGYTH